MNRNESGRSPTCGDAPKPPLNCVDAPGPGVAARREGDGTPHPPHPGFTSFGVDPGHLPPGEDICVFPPRPVISSTSLLVVAQHPKDLRQVIGGVPSGGVVLAQDPLLAGEGVLGEGAGLLVLT